MSTCALTIHRVAPPNVGVQWSAAMDSVVGMRGVFDLPLQGDVLQAALGKDVVTALFTNRHNLRLKKYVMSRRHTCDTNARLTHTCVCRFVTEGAFDTVADLLSHLPKEYPLYRPPPEGTRDVLHGACIAVTGTVTKSYVYPLKVWSTRL